MARSFGLVDDKLEEAAFFFEHLETTGNLFDARCFMSAFATACRSVTFAMQASLSEAVGFREWYEAQQVELRSDERARYFNEVRRLSEHVGLNPITGGATGRSTDGAVSFRFHLHDPRRPFGFAELPEPPGIDAVAEARAHLVTLVKLVKACYEHFGPVIDPQAYYTEEHFAKMGRTIADAEEEIIGVRGWTDWPGAPLEERWRLLRRQVGESGVGYLFDKYLV